MDQIQAGTPRPLYFFAITGARTNLILPTKFLPNPNQDVNHYATVLYYAFQTYSYILVTHF